MVWFIRDVCMCENRVLYCIVFIMRSSNPYKAWYLLDIELVVG